MATMAALADRVPTARPKIPRAATEEEEEMVTGAARAVKVVTAVKELPMEAVAEAVPAERAG